MTVPDKTRKPSPTDFIFPIITFLFFGLLFFGTVGVCIGSVFGLYLGTVFRTTGRA
jgi:hypothetical protein